MPDPTTIVAYDVFRIRIPLRTPYHLSKVYGTLTHSDVLILRVETSSGTVGWGEADPGGKKFTGDSPKSAMAAVREGAWSYLKGLNLEAWAGEQQGLRRHGSLGAAADVAIHDALGRLSGVPVWKLLGEKRRDQVEVLWPTSSGTAAEDLEVIRTYAQKGFRTFMLKMGDRPINEDLDRIREVIAQAPEDVRVMADANQGWTREEASTFLEGLRELPVILVEQPLPADDLEGLRGLRQRGTPISVDESLQNPESAEQILQAEAADVFSIKISKNGGLQNSLAIGQAVAAKGQRILMNSMIELGITQSASLHLGGVLPGLMDCGHAYMSTLRMSDDITDFSDWVTQGTAHLPDLPGLGVTVDEEKIQKYLEDEFHG